MQNKVVSQACRERNSCSACYRDNSDISHFLEQILTLFATGCELSAKTVPQNDVSGVSLSVLSLSTAESLVSYR